MGVGYRKAFTKTIFLWEREMKVEKNSKFNNYDASVIV